MNMRMYNNKINDAISIKFRSLIAIFLLFTIQVNAQNLAWSRKCSPNQKEAYTAAFSTDGKKIFSGSEHLPTSVRIFDADNGNILWDDTLSGGLMCAQDVKFSTTGSKIVTLEENGNILIYDYSTPTPAMLKSIKTPSNYAFSVVISPDGKKFAVGCSDKKLVTYSMDDGSLLRNIDAHLNWVSGVDWSVNNQVATCGDDKLIKLWDTAGNIIRTFSGHTNSVTCVRFTPDGSNLISCSRDMTIKIWDVAAGTLLKTLTGHTKLIKRLDISDDGTKIVSGSEDETIKTWNLSTGILEKSFGVAGCGIIYSVDYKPGSTRYITTATGNGDVQVWDMLFPTGVSENILNTGTPIIYPNPFCQSFIIESDNDKIQSISLTDVHGRVTIPEINRLNNRNECNMKNAAPGVYFLSIQTSEGIIIRKLFKH